MDNHNFIESILILILFLLLLLLLLLLQELGMVACYRLEGTAFPHYKVEWFIAVT
jgi:hypothetical protein